MILNQKIIFQKTQKWASSKIKFIFLNATQQKQDCLLFNLFFKFKINTILIHKS
jgi:hypothetical protein